MRRSKVQILVAVTLALALDASAPCAAEAGAPADAPAPTAVVPGGTYRPLLGGAPVETPAFRLDRVPVTNGEFLAFVREHPEWRRDRVAPVVAEEGYLAQWAAPEALGSSADADQPVVHVSWFAARAYCAARSERLPTEAEWEIAARASRTSSDGSNDPAWRAEVLALDVRTLPARLPRVGSTAPNVFGIHDLHGVVWEWVADFHRGALAIGGGSDRLRFCGAGAAEAGAGDGMDFAAFERVAMRSALRASYTTSSLGFRCAADTEKP